MSQQNIIEGLVWEKRWRIGNGQDDSFVIPFPTLNSVNIVSHGEKVFDYDHYGIHLGQMDRLTFLGPANQKIRATFIDCRLNSTSARVKQTMEFSPSSEKTLCIPPGVAHRFEGLEKVFTLNEYKLFLPDPMKWLEGKTQWRPSGDVINIPETADEAMVKLVEPNPHEAAPAYYEQFGKNQTKGLVSVAYEHPATTEYTDNQGRTHLLKLKRKLRQDELALEFNDSSHLVSGIDGVRWEKHLFLPSGPDSGFTVLADPLPFYIVEHGEISYSHDTYGIHLGQQDRLTFVGPLNHRVTLHLLDCRIGSRTFHKKISLQFQPSSRRFLVIPPGVAHRFENFETVYTFNRPRIFLPMNLQYVSQADVIDWPENKLPYPSLATNNIVADETFYKRQIEGQKRMMLNPSNVSTPIVQLAEDKNGKLVRVVFRKKIKNVVGQ